MTSMILVRGLPGSGKSTIAKNLIGFYMHVEADMFWINDQGEYEFDPKRIGEAHTWCQNRTYELLAAGFNVVVSNTFTTKKEMRYYFEMARDFDCVPQIVLCQGQYGSIHNVPQEALDRMAARFEYDVSDLYNTESDYWKEAARFKYDVSELHDTQSDYWKEGF